MAGPSSLQQEAIPDALQKSCLILSCCLARRSQGGLMTLLTFLCLPCCLDKSRPMDGSDQLVWEAVTTSSLCSLSTKDCTQVKSPSPLCGDSCPWHQQGICVSKGTQSQWGQWGLTALARRFLPSLSRDNIQAALRCPGSSSSPSRSSSPPSPQQDPGSL